MNAKVMKAVKIIVPVASIAASVATRWLKDKEFDEKVNNKVAEILTKQNGEES